MYFDPWPLVEARRGAKHKSPEEGEDGPGRMEMPGKQAGEAPHLGRLLRVGAWGAVSTGVNRGLLLVEPSETNPSQACVSSGPQSGFCSRAVIRCHHLERERDGVPTQRKGL